MSHCNLLTLTFAILVLFPSSYLYTQEGTRLFAIVERDRIGFINQKGEVVVRPQFYSGSEFSEGLAAVRNGGLYGYIDTKGNFAIAPRFEYATSFQEGVAIVYNNGKPYYIDKNGQQLFSNCFQELSPFEGGLARVKTASGKEGMVNRSGKLMIDSVFRNIHPFQEGVAIVEGLRNRQNDKRGKYISEIGLIDKAGKFIVPYGKYDEIKDFENGYASVSIREKKGDENRNSAFSGFIDRKGEVILLRQNKNNSWIEGNLSNCRAKVNLYKYWIPDEKGVLWSSGKSYAGYVNRNGEVVLNDTLLEKVTDFAEGRAFIQKKFGAFYMIDTNGRTMTNQGYRKVLNERFINGMAFVYTDSGWGIIDHNGNYILPPTYYDIDERGIMGEIFFYGGPNENKESENKRAYGIAKVDGRIITPPLFHWMDDRGFVNGLLRVRIDDALAYIDTSGKVVWKQSKEKDTILKNLNIDFMNRESFYAYSIIETQKYNGWARSQNLATNLDDCNAKPGFYVIVDTTSKTLFHDRYNGYAVSVVNNSNDTVVFNAQDSRLYMVVEALDPKGEWKPIEYSPNSWCGNSYHTLALAPQNKWTFSTPVYEGSYKTKLRISLRYIDPTVKKKGRTSHEVFVYSNEFDGSINPGQFWRKPDYHPAGIMDPYNE